MTCSPAAELAGHFWALMATNDFAQVATVLAADAFVLEWPQSGERIRGAANFVRMNQEYPAQGLWKFKLLRLMGDEVQAVSEVEVSDDVQRAIAITFFAVDLGKIARIVEYWPESFAPQANRAHLVERMA